MMLTRGNVDYGMLIRQQVRLLSHLQNLNHLSVLFVYQPVVMLIVTINHVTNVLKVDMKYVTRAVILVNALRRRTGMVQCVWYNYYQIRFVHKSITVDQISILPVNQVVILLIDVQCVSPQVFLLFLLLKERPNVEFKDLPLNHFISCIDRNIFYVSSLF
jgi:hypothetical protein